MELVHLVVGAEEHVHPFAYHLSGHDEPWTVGVPRTTFAEEVIRCLLAGEDDERLAAHVQIHDGAILFAPVVELEPWKGLGELKKVAD